MKHVFPSCLESTVYSYCYSSTIVSSTIYDTVLFLLIKLFSVVDFKRNIDDYFAGFVLFCADPSSISQVLL